LFDDQCAAEKAQAEAGACDRDDPRDDLGAARVPDQLGHECRAQKCGERQWRPGRRA
jgi:hypothetical protein